MTLRTTPLAPGAAAPLALLHAACFPEDPWDTEALCRILGLAGVFGIVAWGGEEPCGFIVARHLGDEAEILTIGVVPACRHRGVARLLLHAAAEQAAGLGAGSLVLEVAEHNTPARSLYAALGFLQVGRRPGYYRTHTGPDDALIMRCMLPIKGR